MAKLKTATFDDIITMTEDFVREHKGNWSQADWQDLLSNLASKGVDLNDEMQAFIEELTGAMKQLWSTTKSTGAISSALMASAKDSVGFVKDNKLIWGAGEWKSFGEHLRRNVSSLSAETRGYVEEIIEAIKKICEVSVETLYDENDQPTRPGPTASAPAAAPLEKKTATLEKKAAPTPSDSAPAAVKPEPPAAKPADAKPAPAAAKPAAAKAASGDDDLTALVGVGPALQAKLKAAGVTTYAQIAALKPEDIAHLEETVIKFSGRIERDDWIGQARELVKKAQ